MVQYHGSVSIIKHAYLYSQVADKCAESYNTFICAKYVEKLDYL